MNNVPNDIRFKQSMGFTVIELLISTVVFATILILITTGVIRLNQAYYKGVTESNTQAVARQIMEGISQAIQFRGGAITLSSSSNDSPTGSPVSHGFCIGNYMTSYILGWQLAADGMTPNTTNHQTYHALVGDTSGNCSGTKAQDMQGKNLTATSIEQLKPNMRLSNLTLSRVSPVGSNLYKIDVRVVYGDDDLLYSPSNNGPTAFDATCTSQAGSQFCAVSELSAVVQRRVN